MQQQAEMGGMMTELEVMFVGKRLRVRSERDGEENVQMRLEWSAFHFQSLHDLFSTHFHFHNHVFL